MKAKIIARRPRAFAVIFETGDDPVEGLTALAGEHRLRSAHFTGIGAFRDAVLAYFDWSRRKYCQIPLRQQVEVVALTGDISEYQGHPMVHAHVVVAGADGSARGGHLLHAHVRPTLEVILTETATLKRTLDRASGLPLINLQFSPPQRRPVRTIARRRHRRRTDDSEHRR
jgi:predicted DNA-binding protein with PD1-like motif